MRGAIGVLSGAGNEAGDIRPMVADGLAMVFTAGVVMTVAGMRAMPLLLALPIWGVLTADAGLYRLQSERSGFDRVARVVGISVIGTMAALMMAMVLGWSQVNVELTVIMAGMASLVRSASLLLTRGVVGGVPSHMGGKVAV